MIVYLNGSYLPETEACLSIWDRGFLLGDGVFETLKVVGGKGEFLKEHFERLTQSTERTGIPLTLNFDAFKTLVETLTCKNEMLDAMVRLTISRGAHKGGLTISNQLDPTVLCTAVSLPFFNQIWWTQGLSVLPVETEGLAGAKSLAAVKATQYQQNIQAKTKAQINNFDDALFIDQQNRILELTTANVFLGNAAEKSIWTPTLEQGILPGVTRIKLIQALKETDWRVFEESISILEMGKFDFALATSSVRGLVPIGNIGNYFFKNTLNSYSTISGVFKSFQEKNK